MITLDLANAAQCSVFFFFVLIFAGFFYFCGFQEKKGDNFWPAWARIFMLIDGMMLIAAILYVITSNL